MRREILIAIAGVLLITLVGYFFFDDKPVRNIPLRSPGPILFFGDSLVEGVGATAGHDLSALLAKELGEPVLNYGVAGDTTRQGLARVRRAVAERPRLVLVLLGGNDFLQKVPRDETFANLKSIITAFQSEGAAVVLIGVRSGIVGGGADDRYEALAEETESAYIEDALKGVFGDPVLMSDAIHPNDRGYEKIAARIQSEITPLLNKD
jgi:lysophospholipase L1-like esterase